MPLMPDVFNSDAFGFLEMTASINKAPYLPRYVSSLGIFEEEGVPVRRISVEEKNGVLELLPLQVPGNIVNTLGENRANARDFTIGHVPVESRIYPYQLAGVREFGSADVMVDVESIRDRETAKHDRSLSATEEWHRLGAVIGLIKDADGSTSLDTFSAFGVSQIATEVFDLATATEAQLHTAIDNVLQNTQDELEDIPVNDNLIALCGTTFFTQLTAHSAVKDAFERWAALVDSMRVGSMSGQPGDFLRASHVYNEFPYRNIRWVHYRGNVSSQQFVADTAAHFFPVGVPGLYVSRYAPSETFFDTVNTVGLPRYSVAMPDQHGRWVDVYSEMNDFHICTRPRVLLQGSTT